MKPFKVHSGRSVLVVLALLLASSGALRTGAGVGAALAKGAEEPKAVSEDTQCAALPAELAAAMTAREAQLATKEQALENRLAALDLANETIDKRMKELEAAENSLKEVLALADGAAEKDLLRLTAVYEAMKPADATSLFSAMAPEFAAGFLSRMQPAAAAAIISGMKPELAYSISVLIAGRNTLVPKG